MTDLPDFLTIAEAARVLRISRTTAYKEANRYLDTGGRAGIPVCPVGGLLRVPRARLEQLAGGPLHWPLPRRPSPIPSVSSLRDRKPVTTRPSTMTAELPFDAC